MAEMVCDERRILIGSLSCPKFALRTARELISAICFFSSLHIINNLLVSRNLFTFISVWKAIQLNVHKSDARKISKCRERCIVTLARVFTENGSWRCRLMQQIKNGNLIKYFVKIAASVRIGKYLSRSFLRIFLYLACCSVHEPTKKELDQYIFLQDRPDTSSVANKCEQELHLESHLFAH